jgi:cytochrome P450
MNSRGHAVIGGVQTVRTLASMRRDPLKTLTNIVGRHGDAVQMKLQGRSVFLLRGPEAVQHVLIKNQDNYNKDSHSLALRSALGNGLLTAAPHIWASHRQAIQPHFAARRLADHAPVMTATAAVELDTWRPGTTEFFARITELSVRVLGATLFGVDFEPYKSRIARAIKIVSEEAGTVALSPFSLLLPSLPGMNVDRAWAAQFRRRRRVSAVVSDVSRLIDEIVVSSRHHDRDTLLDLLLRTYEESVFTAEDVRDEIITFLLAGAETVAVTLTWMWYLLDRNPEVRQAMIAEIRESIGTDTPTAADVRRLPLTKAIVDETMRIYPPIWLMSRTAVSDDAFGDRDIPAGSLVLMSPYLNHRDERWWDHPATFDPARFVGRSDRPRLTYLPFGAGRRMCIGAGLGTMQTILTAVMTIQRFHASSAYPSRTVQPLPRTTLRPHSGLPLILTAA